MHKYGGCLYYEPDGYPCGYVVGSQWVDPNRTRGKYDHPYSYDEFFIFGSRTAIKDANVSAAYSDRLWEWDGKKFDRLWADHVGKRWDQASPDQLSKFISAYHDQKLEAVALAEGCNVSNGYPYWVLWYKDAPG